MLEVSMSSDWSSLIIPITTGAPVGKSFTLTMVAVSSDVMLSFVPCKSEYETVTEIVLSTSASSGE